MFDYARVIPQVVAEMKPSGIRKYFGIMETMPDAISLGVGEPDFITPQHIMQAGIDSLCAGKTQYTANAGLMLLRKEIGKYMEKTFDLSYNPDNEILATVGGSEAIDLCLRAFLTVGDEILIPEPSFVCYAPLASMTGARPVPIVTTKENSFKLMPDALRAAITPRTKALVLSYPNNPTGGIMTREELQAVADVLKDTNIVVISDEIYAELTYGRKHCSIAAIDGMWDRTVVVSGFSKAFAMTGWRLGYCCGPKELMKPVMQIHQYALMCASTPAQYAGIEALQKGLPDTRRMCEEYDTRRQYIYRALLDMGFDCFEPEGAFYIFPDVSMYAADGGDFVESLLRDQQVAVVPGDAFGESGKNHVRISYAYSMETLKKAMDRIGKFVAKK
ncbi:MAG: aminotransferase class I/II-fold pyridoxal phosphate-dependent enzyme [Clostridia bacterium]|nr:aminotransferase class I/II-fold pyridoxal phosphate-dependent enzyme [Clostridia bacterium]